MAADQYIETIISKYKSETGNNSQPYRIANSVMFPIIKGCFGEDLKEVSFSGSYAKGTGIKGDSDLDLFISLNYLTDFGLKQAYWNLFHFLKNNNQSL